MDIRNYTYFTPIPINKDAAGKVLIDGISKLNMPYWVSAGTALGFYRNGDFIDGDTDVDIAMLGHDGIAAEIRSLLNDYYLIREVYHDGKVMQLAFVMDNTIFDIYIHWKSGEDYINVAESGLQRQPCYMYDNLSTIETKYGTFNMPSDPEKYFEIRYGEDWRTPQEKKAHFEAV
jgi:fukutin